MAWIGVAASVVGSMISSEMQSGAAEEANSAQQQSTDAAVAEQRRQYDLSRGDIREQIEQGRKDTAPYREAGSAAVGRLSNLLGLKPAAEAGGTADTGGFNLDQAMEQYIDKLNVGTGNATMAELKAKDPEGYKNQMDLWRPSLTQNVFAGDIKQAADAKNVAQTSDPEFGELNKKYVNENKYVSKKFTLADFWDDPVTKASYQQGLDQGTKALTNMAGARGSLNSGGQLKALARFATDYTGRQAGESRNRFVSDDDRDYNRFHSEDERAYNRFYGDQDRTFNRLSGLAGTGQTAATNAAQTGSQDVRTGAVIGANTANTVGNLLTAGGNARGAAAIAGGNAWSSGIQSGGNTLANWWNRQNNAGGGSSVNYSNYDRYNDPYGGP